ncbi:MAG: Nif3-like dinuclear metal center hexameric protein [Chloroflexota bacterium]|nr:Nif3-like dinuclear metal center hexameric protein [Chloroflexota bacterium]
MTPTSTITIQDAIDTIVSATAVAPLSDTVDTVKTGDPTRPLTGIVTTFMATGAVIARTAELGANFLITHEPTFYTHLDETAWLQADAVYQAKRRLIDAHGIVIWRFHDYWHRTQPDGILMGVIERLGWKHEEAVQYPYVATIAPLSLAELAGQVKARLDIATVRVTGPDDLVCRRVGLLVGAPGGRMQMAALQRDDVDAIICGEINEWETSEYVRDAAFFGRPKGLIVVGHASSEEDGMAYLARWLRPHLPGVPITHVPAGDPLRVV